MIPIFLKGQYHDTKFKVETGNDPQLEELGVTAGDFWGFSPIGGSLFPRVGYSGRPLTVDDAGVLGEGENEIELGAEAFNSSGIQTDASVVGAYSRGLTKRGLQFTLGFPFSSVHPHGGATEKDIGDFAVELKAVIWGEGKNYPAFTVKPSVSLPTGDVAAGTGSGEVEYSLTAIFSKDFGPFGAHFNLALTHAVESKEETLFYGAALEAPVTSRLDLVSEITSSDNLDLEGGDRPIEMLLGLTYELKKGLVLDFGLKFGLNDVSADFGAIAGATIAF